MEHITVVMDPDLGTIAAAFDEAGVLVSTAYDEESRPPTNLAPYLAAMDETVAELATLYARANPGHAEWLERQVWEWCLREGGA